MLNKTNRSPNLVTELSADFGEDAFSLTIVMPTVKKLGGVYMHGESQGIDEALQSVILSWAVQGFFDRAAIDAGNTLKSLQQRAESLESWEAILKELLEMSVNDVRDESVRSPYLEENLDRVRQLGRQLLEIGGEALMYRVAESVPPDDIRELEMAWDGIGMWQG